MPLMAQTRSLIGEVSCQIAHLQLRRRVREFEKCSSADWLGPRSSELLSDPSLSPQLHARVGASLSGRFSASPLTNAPHLGVTGLAVAPP